MNQFRLTIDLGNDGMSTALDIAGALRDLADDFTHQDLDALSAAWVNTRGVRDDNGNTVGNWAIVERSDDDAHADAEGVLGGPAQPLDPSKLIKALCAVVLDPVNRAAIDPKALEQARAALGLGA